MLLIASAADVTLVQVPLRHASAKATLKARPAGTGPER
jgi:hypothetical protein